MNGYIDKGIGFANAGDLYNGLIQLGYALHVAQDRGSHGDGYTADYVQSRPHDDIDNMSLNPQGVEIALEHSREAINRFYSGLNEQARQALVVAGMPTGPPLLQTPLLPVSPESGRQPLLPPEAREEPAGGINILSIRF
mgnify:CR=1 FL=1